MVRISKVTTKVGDKGETYLAAGKIVKKDSCHIEVIGCLDELNAFLGLSLQQFDNEISFNFIQHKLMRIQNELFDLGAQLAVLSQDRRADTPKIVAADVATLEREIAELNANLPHLKSFVIPGQNKISAYLHVARTVCRRTERALVQFAETNAVSNVELKYINRLSDWLFVASRYVVVNSGLKELLWQQGKRD